MSKLKSFFLSVAILSIVLMFSATSYAQTEKIQGIRLNDGSIIYGKVLQINVEKVTIEGKDGKISTYKFNDVETFIKEGQEESAADALRGTTKVAPGKKDASHSGDGFYMGANAGLVMLKDVDAKDPSTGIPLTFKFSPGFALGAVAGYGYGYVRGEAEIMYQKNNLDKVKVLGVEGGVSGDVSNLAFLFNGYFDIKNPSIVTPYLSGGIGVARVDLSKITVTGIGDYTTKSYDDTVFAYQVGAGVGIALTEKVTLDL